jgi:hypothetical protein
MKEIFPIDDSPFQPALRLSFVLFFKAFLPMEGLEKERADPT